MAVLHLFRSAVNPSKLSFSTYEDFIGHCGLPLCRPMIGRSLPQCVRYLHVLHSAWLSLTQHAEQQQDQLLDVLQRLLLGHQVRVHLVQYLQNTEQRLSEAPTYRTSSQSGSVGHHKVSHPLHHGETK